jgi:HEAT repeat protein
LYGQVAKVDPAKFWSYEETLRFITFGATDLVSYPGWRFDAQHQPAPLDDDEMAFFERLGACGTDTARALPIFVEGLAHRSELVRSTAVFGAALLASGDEDVRRRFLELGDDESPRVLRTVVQATSRFPMDARVEAILRRALRDMRGETIGDEEWQTRIEAVRAVELRGAAGAGFLDDVEAGLARPLDDRVWYAKAYARIGGDPNAAVDAVLDGGFERREDGGLEGALTTIAKFFQVDASLASRRIAPLMRDANPDVQVAAAAAYTACGGERDEATRIVVAGAVNQVDGATSAFNDMMRGRRLSTQVLVELLDAPQPLARTWAAWALGHLGHEPALPKLRAMRGDADPSVATVAGDAVRFIEYLRDEQE